MKENRVEFMLEKLTTRILFLLTESTRLGSGMVQSVWDSGFDCSWEARFTKIEHRMQDSDITRKWDAGFS